MLRTAHSTAIETLFPPRCAGCGHRGTWVCERCLAKTELLEEPLCARCGDPPSICSCSSLDQSLDWVRAAAWYEGWLREAIIAFKYEGEFARAGHLAGMLAPVLQTCAPGFEIVPVPLHPSRQERRGYNQAEKLGEALSELTSANLSPKLIQRVVPTSQQTRLSAVDRAKNVKDAFAVRDKSAVAGKRLLLVDDVMTTGSTLGECATMLKQQGADWVGAVTVARER